jgi:hypothetical protein
VQTPQLQHDEEPAEELGAAGIQQVLPLLPEAHGAQGEQVTIGGWLLVIAYCIGLLAIGQ